MKKVFKIIIEFKDEIELNGTFDRQVGALVRKYFPNRWKCISFRVGEAEDD